MSVRRKLPHDIILHHANICSHNFHMNSLIRTKGALFAPQARELFRTFIAVFKMLSLFAREKLFL